ncbi:MAG: tetratricopeptide repeat protein [Planctomycetes bacterium]|nr:tetratricopeptide repeat protein [Planctomycetota bacterium]
MAKARKPRGSRKRPACGPPRPLDKRDACRHRNPQREAGSRRGRPADDALAPPVVQEPVATYGPPSAPAATELSPELAPHAGELTRLAAFVDLAEGFRLAFAECNFAPLRKAIFEEVRRRCEPEIARLCVIDLSDADDMIYPLDAIARRIPKDEAPVGAPKRVLMFVGLEAHVHITDPQPGVLVALNMARDAFPARIPEPMVFWLPDYLLTTLCRLAPDFWAWANATFRFPAPQALREWAFSRTMHAEPHILDSQAAEVEARLGFLESLLQEYLPSVGELRADRVPAVLDILNELGAGYCGLGEAMKAITYLSRMLDLARSSCMRRQEGWALGNLGLAYADLGQTRKAIECHEEALRIGREVGDRRYEGADLGNLGLAYAALGETRKAIEYHQQALAIERKLGDRRGEGQTIGNLGNAYADLGEMRTAVMHYEQQLRIAREVGRRRGEGVCLGNLGLAYAALGEIRKAIECHEEALRIEREIGDRRGEGHTLGNLGLAYAALGETKKAIEHHEHALKIARELGDRLGEGHALGNLGLAHAALGESWKAIEHYEQALKIHGDIEDRGNEAIWSWNLGVQYAKLGDLRRAVELMQARVDYEREVGHADAEKHAAAVEELRGKIKEGVG